jgi:ankyrin repeat protein
MAKALPPRPNLEWLRKTAKQALAAMRKRTPEARLANAQLRLARDYGFSSWRALKAHVDQLPASRDASQPDDPTVAAFLHAVGIGEARQVRAALAATPAIVNAVGPHPFWGGRVQALHLSIDTARRDMFDLLLGAGADVNGTNDGYEHWSPLMLTVHWNRPDMQQELLRRGAKVGLFEALLFADDERVERMLRIGRAALPAAAPGGGSLLALARTPFAIDRLLELGASTDRKDMWDSTPIGSLSRLGARGQPLVRHLIARGLRAAPVEFARLGDRAALQALMEQDPSIVKQDDVLVGAAEFGHLELVRWLLQRGANPSARSSQGSRGTALHGAAWEGNLELAKVLVAAGADLNAHDLEHRATPAQFARVAVDVTNNPQCGVVATYLEEVMRTGR